MQNEVSSLIQSLRPEIECRRPGKIFTDTTDFTALNYGDVIAVGGKHYFIVKDEVERSFSFEDPKYWVKRCIVLETGERRILKLVFHESFEMKLGSVKVRCWRSPEKESRILDTVQGDLRFMQGKTLADTAGNAVRIIEIIRGNRLDKAVSRIDKPHEVYFYEDLPGILEKFVESCRAIGDLHRHGEKHGDIRRDHLWLESGTGRYRWIDFDYTYDFAESPYGLDIYGLGSLLIFLVGKWVYTMEALRELDVAEEKLESLVKSDFSLLYTNRIVNLRKLFPYIPERLNNVLMHFSQASNVFYESVDEFLDDLIPCLDLIGVQGNRQGTREPEGVA